MVAGTLAASGWHLAPDLFAPRAANPKGFFEAPEINGINEALLAPVLPDRPRLGAGQRWLGVPNAPVRSTPELDARMLSALRAAPFCHKDPRFSFTLPAWRPHLPDATGFVCVFRDPALTAQSLLEECRTARYLRGVELDREHALELWSESYRAILEQRDAGGEFLFLHYDQALAPSGLARLARFLGAPLDASFPDRALRRPPPDGDCPPEVRVEWAIHRDGDGLVVERQLIY